MHTGLTQLHTGLKQLHFGLKQLQTSLKRLHIGLKQLHTGLKQFYTVRFTMWIFRLMSLFYFAPSFPLHIRKPIYIYPPVNTIAYLVSNNYDIKSSNNVTDFLVALRPHIRGNDLFVAFSENKALS